MHMPNQCHFGPEIKQQAVEMLDIKSNKKMLQNHLIHVTGKPVILKDLHNLYTKSKPKSKCDFQELVDAMRRMKDAVITTFVDGNNVLWAIFFQTLDMKNTFKSYPELLFIDATYKLNDLQIPLYVLLAVDGNGESEIVCLWIVQCEDKEIIASLLVEFKQHNDSRSLIKCVMSDKDMTERNVIKEHFPQANLLICLFHTMRTFKREISCDKLGISQSERTLCLELLTKMAYVQSETAYTTLYNEFRQSVPKIATDYFDDNWHGIREQWVDGLKNSWCNYLNRTTERNVLMPNLRALSPGTPE
ncbi:zinc finger SWIM domain-containing protein 3-like isoform X1 [Dysidea avara]|uniref:zinc finger SWIM domain-containing protein 3-like isoform X1 n=1 Tax=Dysidea avara TaxID=196820 RepID=UPI00331EA834